MATIESVASSGLNLVFILVTIVFVGALIGATVWFIGKQLRFKEYDCYIWQHDGFGHLRQRFDKAGIYTDKKTDHKLLFLKKSNVGLKADNIPYVPTGKGKAVFLLQTGLKNFKFIKPELKEDHVKLSIGEEDINWALHEFKKDKVAFDQKGILQILQLMLPIFALIVVMIVAIQLIKKFDVLVYISDRIVEAAAILQANSAQCPGVIS